MKTIITFLMLTMAFTTNSHAQIGGLLKKAKDKSTEKKTSEKKPDDATDTPTNNQNDNSTNNNSTTNKEVKKAATSPKDENTPEGYFLVNNPLGKISFGCQPFSNSAVNSKATFKSNEFIYGRLQLNSGTLKDAFKMEDKSKSIPFYSIEYVVEIYKKSKTQFSNGQIWNSCLVKDADLTKNYFDFDVLPNPENATTIISALSDFSAGKSAAPLGGAIKPEVFYEDGIYKVDVILRYPANDAWGKRLSKDKWPTFEADFDFEFSSNDIATLKKNNELAIKKAKSNMENEPLSIPKEWAAKSYPLMMGLTQEKMYNMLLGENAAHNKIIKLNATQSSGGWHIQYNDLGIPTYRYSAQWYTLFCKNTKTGKCWYQGFGLRQNYAGGGTYSATFIDTNDQGFIVNCDDMK